MLCSFDGYTDFFEIVTGVLQEENTGTISIHNLPKIMYY